YMNAQSISLWMVINKVIASVNGFNPIFQNARTSMSIKHNAKYHVVLDSILPEALQNTDVE
ncbi:hypothetical protein, partial [Staphylococcus condimenti]|uniref:hypothetical protein n=1 Tax=Staphylococcus condimenti TaxID=70255 RepID=UPI001A91FE3C